MNRKYMHRLVAAAHESFTAIKISRFGVGLLQYLCNTHTMQCRIYVPTAIPTSLSPSYIFSLNSISTYIIHTFTVTEQITEYITHTQRQSFPLQYPQTPFLLHYPHSATSWVGYLQQYLHIISPYFYFVRYNIYLLHLVLSIYVLHITLHPLSLLCIPSSHPIIYTPHWFVLLPEGVYLCI